MTAEPTTEEVTAKVESNDQAQLMAQNVIELYQAIGAQNYLEVLIQDTRPGGHKYAITIQRENGETPGQRVQALQAVVKELGVLLNGLLPDIEDYEQIRRESWPKEIERGELVLDAEKMTREALAGLKKAGLWGTN